MKIGPRNAFYDLEEDERRRDVFRPASKKQLETYTTALSGTLTQLEDHPDFVHLNNGVEPSPAQLRLAQRGEVFPLPLDGDARVLFFETLLARLRTASGSSGEEDQEGRPQFLFVLKSIGQKVRRISRK